MRNVVHERRIASQLGQSELASRARISRQALLAIEAGRSTPSVDVAMRIAHALGVTVDALFAAEIDAPIVKVDDPGARSGRVTMAWIRDRWVAHALGEREHDVGADAIVSARRATFLREPESARDNVVLMGCAPALGPICDRLNGARGGRYVWLARSSEDALRALHDARTHVAGLHLVDARTGESNVGYVRRASASAVLVTLAHWEVGLVVAKGNPLSIRRAADVARRGVRLVTRERGSGARRMLERALVREGASASRASSRVIAKGHREVGRCIAVGACDVGPAVRDVAIASDLDFVPLGSERFDLALARTSLEDPRIARFLDALTSAPVRSELRALGYDVEKTGSRVA